MHFFFNCDTEMFPYTPLLKSKAVYSFGLPHNFIIQVTIITVSFTHTHD